jgi:hypothetical protein
MCKKNKNFDTTVFTEENDEYAPSESSEESRSTRKAGFDAAYSTFVNANQLLTLPTWISTFGLAFAVFTKDAQQFKALFSLKYGALASLTRKTPPKPKAPPKEITQQGAAPAKQGSGQANIHTQKKGAHQPAAGGRGRSA